jgi:hypothetical protein
MASVMMQIITPELGGLYVEEFYSRIYIDGMLRRYHGKAPNLY